MNKIRKKIIFLFQFLGIAILIFSFCFLYFLFFNNNVSVSNELNIIEEVSDTVSEYLNYDVPVISIQTDPDNLYDDEIGIFVEGNLRKEWWDIHTGEKLDDTTIFLAPANFWQKGKDWERPIQIDIYDPEKGKIVSQNAGMRINGGWSRGNGNQKSVRIFAREEYDKESKIFNYAIFPNLKVKNGSGKYLTAFKRFVLRNGGNDYGNTRIRDEVMQDIASQAGLDTQASRAAIFILNDKFYGVTQIKQTYDRYYFKDNYGANEENVVILEIADKVPIRAVEGEETDVDDFNSLKEFIVKGGNKAEEDKRKEKIENELDVEETLLYYAYQIYIGNGDWPHNNSRIWRYNNPSSINKNGKLDGRWRFLLFDTDFGLGLYGDHTVDLLSKCLDEKGDGGLFYGLMKYEEYKQQFIDIMYDLTDNYFTQENTNRVIALRQFEIAPVIGLISDKLNWDGLVQRMRIFISNRNNEIIKQLENRLGGDMPENFTEKEIKTNNGFISDYMKNRILIRGTLYDKNIYVIEKDGKHYVPVSVFSSLGTGSLDETRKIIIENTITIKNPDTGKSGQYVDLSDVTDFEKLNITYLEDINSLLISKS
ncbi:MAG: xghA1 [Clostridia bacterium]|nr:xghA1 [Clostridia bacterium]